MFRRQVVLSLDNTQAVHWTVRLCCRLTTSKQCIGQSGCVVCRQLTLLPDTGPAAIKLRTEEEEPPKLHSGLVWWGAACFNLQKSSADARALELAAFNRSHGSADKLEYPWQGVAACGQNWLERPSSNVTCDLPLMLLQVVHVFTTLDVSTALVVLFLWFQSNTPYGCTDPTAQTRKNEWSSCLQSMDFATQVMRASTPSAVALSVQVSNSSTSVK